MSLGSLAIKDSCLATALRRMTNASRVWPSFLNTDPTLPSQKDKCRIACELAGSTETRSRSISRAARYCASAPFRSRCTIEHPRSVYAQETGFAGLERLLDQPR